MNGHLSFGIYSNVRCIYVCVCVCMCACMCMCVYVCMYVDMCMKVYGYLYEGVQIFA